MNADAQGGEWVARSDFEGRVVRETISVNFNRTRSPRNETDPLGRPLAGFPRRVLATLVDTAVIFCVSALVLVVYWVLPWRFFGNLSFWWLFTGGLLGGQILAGLIRGLYDVLSWSLWSQTLGNKVASTLVVNGKTGRPVTVVQATVRFLVQFGFHLVPALGPAVDNGWCLFSQDRRTLHDKAARTAVVRSR